MNIGKYFSSFLLCAFLLPSPAVAQGKPAIGEAHHSQAGVMNLNVEEKAKNPYKENQKQAIEHIKALLARLNELKAGKDSRIDSASDGAIHYMTGAYLYCTLTKGACPELLDPLFETDLINSRISKQAECPNMLKFWHDWQANDMENRQKFLVRIGNLATTSAFTANVRPRYIKCKESIDNELRTGKTNADYFRQRYADSDDSRAASLKKALELTEAFEKSIGDIFATIQQMRK